MYVSEKATDFYIETPKLKTVFDNIEDLRFDNGFLESLHFFGWFTLILSLLIFVFRTSGLKNLLFTLISGAIIVIFVGLFVVLFDYLFKIRHENYVTYVVSVLISVLILKLPLTLMKRNFKMISGVLINLSLFGFPVLVFIIFLLLKDINYYLNHENNLFYKYEFLLSPVVFVLSVIFVYLRCFIIKKWKGLTEG